MTTGYDDYWVLEESEFWWERSHRRSLFPYLFRQSRTYHYDIEGLWKYDGTNHKHNYLKHCRVIMIRDSSNKQLIRPPLSIITIKIGFGLRSS